MVKKLNFIFMLKRMESLGTAVSRNEAKMVVGGDIAPMTLGLGDGDGVCGNLKSNCIVTGCCEGYSCISIGYHKICDSNIA